MHVAIIADFVIISYLLFYKKISASHPRLRPARHQSHKIRTGIV
jgi:hypothetical protein